MSGRIVVTAEREEGGECVEELNKLASPRKTSNDTFGGEAWATTSRIGKFERAMVIQYMRCDDITHGCRPSKGYSFSCGGLGELGELGLSCVESYS